MSHIVIKTLTPIHIGNGRVLNKNIDYVYFSNNQSQQKILAVLDINKIAQKIDASKMPNWISCILKKEDILKLIFPNKQHNNISLTDVQSISHRIIQVKDSSENRSQFYEHIYNAQLQPYIPGSSLKGAITTAILANLFRKESEIVNQNLFRKQNGTDNLNLNSSQLIELVSGDQKNTQMFRFLQITDATFENTQVMMINAYSQSNSGWENYENISQWTECIPSNQVAKCRIRTLDDITSSYHSESKKEIEQILHKNHIYIKDYKALVKEINTHTKHLLEKEIQIMKEQDEACLANYIDNLERQMEELEKCQENECILRLGKYMGYQFITGGWIEDIVKDEKEIYFEVRKNRNYKEYIMPKTRRFTKEGAPLGFIKLVFANTEKEHEELYTELKQKTPQVGDKNILHYPPPVSEPAIPKPYKGKLERGAIVPAVFVGSDPNDDSLKKFKLLCEKEQDIYVTIKYYDKLTLNSYHYLEIASVQKSNIHCRYNRKF